MKYLVLITVAILLFFVIPTLVPSHEAREEAARYDFKPEQIDRGALYAAERRLINVPSLCLSLGLLLFLVEKARPLANLCSRLMRGRWLPTVLLMGLIYALASELINVPFGLLRLEHMRSWDMTQRSQADWLIDHYKAFVVYGGVEALVLACFFSLIRWLPRAWWLVSAVGATLLGALAALLLPVVFAPLFNTFEPLHESEWKGLEPRVRLLLKKAGVQVNDILVVDASRQSGHTNAYFTGFGPTRRIVLYDTLLKKHSPEEIESILAHELGHWQHDHIVKGIALAGLASFVGFYLLYRFLDWLRGRAPWYLKSAADPAALPIILLCVTLAEWVTMPAQNVVSRYFERQADAVSLELGKQPKAFIDAERKLALDNISNLTTNAWTRFLYGTHPSTVERIQMAEDWRNHGSTP